MQSYAAAIVPGSLVAALGLSVSLGCAPSAAEEVVADLPARPDTAHCLADLDASVPASEVTLPNALSATGCFEDLASLAPAPDLVPYRITSALWTDGVVKQRFIVLPPDTTIGFRENEPWAFPPGTILIKAFILEAERGNPDSRRSIETRFMIRASDGWEFFSYKWDEDGTEAFLNSDPHAVEFEIRDGDEVTTIAFEYPSHDGCVTCHAEVAGVALGPHTEQLNRLVHYESGAQNQLEAMQAIGLFDQPLPRAPQELPALVSPADTSAPVELRARSYLHGNCSHCHQPGGYNSTVIDMDLRYDTPLAEAKICGQPIHHRIHIDDGELIIDPGDPDNSNLYGRMTGTGISKMPPLGRSIVDPVGVEAVRAWIESLTECP